MNKQKSAKRTNMRNVNSQRADEKNITKVFNIADLMRVQCTSVMVIFPLASNAHLFFFFFSKCIFAIQLSRPAAVESQVLPKNAYLTYKPLFDVQNACVAMHFIYLFLYWRTVKTI